MSGHARSVLAADAHARRTRVRHAAASPALSPRHRRDTSSFTAMDVRLDGKVALVTGASKGIGRAIAAAFAASGARVMLSSRKQDALDEAAATMDGEVATYAANAGEPEQAEACVQATMATFGAVDILVNNAATNPYMGPSIDIDLARYDKTLQVNLRGPLDLDAARVEHVDARPRRRRDQHRVRRRLRHRAADRHLQHDEGGAHLPHAHLGRGTGARAFESTRSRPVW